jgi:hypothetical protein
MRPPGRSTRAISKRAFTGIGEVHEHPLGADGIESTVGKAEGLRVADLERDRKVPSDGPTGGLVD